MAHCRFSDRCIGDTMRQTRHLRPFALLVNEVELEIMCLWGRELLRRDVFKLRFPLSIRKLPNVDLLSWPVSGRPAL